MDRLRHRQVSGAEFLAEIDVLSVLEESDGIPETIAHNNFDLPDCYRTLVAKHLRQIEPRGP